MTRTTRRVGALVAGAAMLVGGAAVAVQPAGAVAPAISATSLSTVLAPVSITSAKLPRRPPALTNPITIRVKDQMGDLRLSRSRDYRIILPTTRSWKNAKGLSIDGGRNVVVVGGTVDVRYGYRSWSGELTKRAAYIRNSTGTVHIEGVRFMSSTTQKLTEGIDVSLPGASLRLFNIRISSPLVGSQSGNHADALQTWAGPRYLFIDGFTATTNYQGMFLTPGQHSSASVTSYDLRRVWLRGLSSGYLLWRDGGSWTVRTSEVYVSGFSSRLTGVWPSVSSWPYVKRTKPTRTFAGSSGYAYRTPGYLS